MTTATRQADCANCPALGAVLCPARGKAPEALGRPPRQLLINPENGPIYLFGGRRHVGLLQSGRVMRVAYVNADCGIPVFGEDTALVDKGSHALHAEALRALRAWADA